MDQFRGQPVPHPTARAGAGRGGVPGAGLAAPLPGHRAGRLVRRGGRLLAARLRQRRRPDRPGRGPVHGGQPGAACAGRSCSATVTLAVLMAATAAQQPVRAHQRRRLRPHPRDGAPPRCSAGIAVANRRAYAASIRDRAEQDARRRVDEERLRIARELHDVVAHTMATINVQAGVAAHVLPTQPEAAAEALQAIKTASKEGLRELRAILNVLRQADDSRPRSARPGPGPARRPGRRGAPGRPADHARRGRGAVPAAGRRGPGRLPHRPGVADQRHPPRRPGGRDREAPLPSRRDSHRRDRHRAGPRPARGRRRDGRARPGRDARTRRRRRRDRADRPAPRWRLPGHGPPARPRPADRASAAPPAAPVEGITQ